MENTENLSAGLFKNSKIIKRVVALALSATLGASILYGCATRTNNPNGGDDVTQGGSSYSQILENVLNDSYYNNLIDNNTLDFDYVRATSPAFKPHPYTFLEKRGHYVSGVKSGDYKCITLPYILDNDNSHLYLSTKVEAHGEQVNYYTNYVLKYPITKSEYNDLCMLADREYIQLPLFIQELAKNKTPSVENETRIEVSTYDGLLDAFNKNKDLNSTYGTKYIAFDLKNVEEINSFYGEHGVKVKIYISSNNFKSLHFKTASNSISRIYDNSLSSKNPSYISISNLEDFNNQNGTKFKNLSLESSAALDLKDDKRLNQ